eukprot:3241147-Rhodomonas_salina.1
MISEWRRKRGSSGRMGQLQEDRMCERKGGGQSTGGREARETSAVHACFQAAGGKEPVRGLERLESIVFGGGLRVGEQRNLLWCCEERERDASKPESKQSGHRYSASLRPRSH